MIKCGENITFFKKGIDILEYICYNIFIIKNGGNVYEREH